MSGCGICGEYNGDHDKFCNLDNLFKANKKLETELKAKQDRINELEKVMENIEQIPYNAFGSCQIRAKEALEQT